MGGAHILNFGFFLFWLPNLPLYMRWPVLIIEVSICCSEWLFYFAFTYLCKRLFFFYFILWSFSRAAREQIVFIYFISDTTYYSMNAPILGPFVKFVFLRKGKQVPDIPWRNTCLYLLKVWCTEEEYMRREKGVVCLTWVLLSWRLLWRARSGESCIFLVGVDFP